MNKTLGLVVRCALIAGMACGFSGSALAQQPASAALPADPQIANLAGLMTGSWKAKVGDKEIVMSVAPVKLSEISDGMYVELAEATSLHNPYRQTILQPRVSGGKLKLRTYELRRPGGRLPSVVGLWAAPEAFPDIKSAELLGTLDLDLVSDGGGFTGRTAAAFPTSAGGAETMTSEMTIGSNGIRVADRGFDGAGKLVWGPAAGEYYTFSKFDPKVSVKRFDGGVVAVDFPVAALGEPAKEEDQVSCNYIGFLADGRVFDRSADRGEPFAYKKSQKLIAGWNAAMMETRKGMKRRLVIPAAMGYGERGRPPVIPANSNLYFDLEVMDVKSMPAVNLGPSLSPGLINVGSKQEPSKEKVEKEEEQKGSPK
jgi:hypothetical protein